MENIKSKPLLLYYCSDKVSVYLQYLNITLSVTMNSDEKLEKSLLDVWFQSNI